jgi:hypothetical protein
MATAVLCALVALAAATAARTAAPEWRVDVCKPEPALESLPHGALVALAREMRGQLCSSRARAALHAEGTTANPHARSAASAGYTCSCCRGSPSGEGACLSHAEAMKYHPYACRRAGARRGRRRHRSEPAAAPATARVSLPLSPHPSGAEQSRAATRKMRACACCAIATRCLTAHCRQLSPSQPSLPAPGPGRVPRSLQMSLPSALSQASDELVSPAHVRQLLVSHVL